jgi:hypothetical protein
MARPRSSTVTRSFAAISSRSSARSTAVLPLAVATSSPTAQFRPHHAVQAPQRDALDAACMWRAWAETVAPTKVQSASGPKIAQELGGASAGAVSAKVGRLGLASRYT